ncbi:hypothetical protein [Chroococcus sp. FPU101]|uniref:hypothetical protein n=1 Tax=Chroococcus sp. FPU101 TaxID=1974212 RepID=UPI001A9084A7|nr:hypothetical protein [Chroococcus sp. FPU101]GFE70039.1 hypothetical protein CFPU101_26490 [Chroococcus sp. FPU101]
MGKTLATFRIDESLWGEFKQLMDEEGTNASAELVKFVSTRLGKLDNLETVNTTNLDERIAEYLDKALDSHLDKYLFNFLTKDEAVTMNQLDHRAQSIIERISPLEKKLDDFDKAFQGLGSTVYDHDRLLSQPLATLDELSNAIATLKTEIEDLRNTFNSSQTDDNHDDSSSQRITKASLDPIFNDDGLSVDLLVEQLGMTRQGIEYKRDKGTLEQLGYRAEKEGKRWKYYKLE